MAEQIGAYKFVECSAKTREGVDELFMVAARAALLVRTDSTDHVVPNNKAVSVGRGGRKRKAGCCAIC